MQAVRTWDRLLTVRAHVLHTSLTTASAWAAGGLEKIAAPLQQ
ncbi:hypothetical protein AB0C96_35790 [Streptomyces sp. NPDC048506]